VDPLFHSRSFVVGVFRVDGLFSRRLPSGYNEHCSKLTSDGDTSLSRRGILGYEGKHLPVLPRKQFAKRMAQSFAIASSLIILSLLTGMAGYHYLEDLPCIDAFVNAAMILGGMGPVAPIQTFGGKLFAGIYALYSGLVVIVAAGVIFAPVIHRMLHQFHSQADEKEGRQ
jgi:hypothetical protein